MSDDLRRAHPWDDKERTLALVARLQREREFRDATGSHFVDGVRGLIAALDADHEVVALLHSEQLLRPTLARQHVRALRRRGVPTVNLSPEQFRRIAQLERASGVGLVLRQRWSKLHRTPPGRGLCWLAVERIRSPGNLGTLLRSADGAGADGLVCLGDLVDPFDPAVVRASMGAFFRQRLFRAGPTAFAHWVRRHRLSVVGASPEAETDFQRCRYRRPTVLLLGDERRGLSESQRALCDQLVRIPMVGAGDSLNVAIAGSLLLYELRRVHPRRSRTSRGHERSARPT